MEKAHFVYYYQSDGVICEYLLFFPFEKEYHVHIIECIVVEKINNDYITFMNTYPAFTFCTNDLQ